MKDKVLVLVLSSLAIAGGLRAASPTVDDVGDVDSFGHSAQYMGVASGSIVLQTDPCPAPTPTPSPSTNPANGDQCFQIVDTSVSQSFDAENSCRINLPKNSTKDMIYPVLNFFYTYNMNNTGASGDQARFQFTGNITIVSDVLNDPSCIDPNTGLPCGGKLVFQFTPNRVFDDRHLDSLEHAQVRLTLTRAGNAGINKANLVSSGLSSTLVDKLFKNPMTLQLNVVGSVKRVDFAQITTNMRLFGD
ncbi:MAG: hypothetical protein ABI925_10115 [Verrucomicrobiota bacterium]